jgi:hypothetical protein
MRQGSALSDLCQTAPPHLPCGAPEVGGTEELFPNLGWVNVVPDGKATANFEIAGTKVEFEGVGYHDKVFSISCELKECC